MFRVLIQWLQTIGHKLQTFGLELYKASGKYKKLKP